MEVAAAVRRGRPRWLNVRTVLGAGLFLASLVAGQRAADAARVTTPVWSAARDLPVGTVLGPDDLVPAEVRLPGGVLASYSLIDTTLEGAVLTRPVTRGELVPSAWVVSEDIAGTVAVTIPIDPGHAAGGDLRPGDTVDVFATLDADDLRARTLPVARDVEVLDVVTAGEAFVGTDAFLGITVRVDEADAARLVLAIRSADLDVVRRFGPVDATDPAPVGVEELR